MPVGFGRQILGKEVGKGQHRVNKSFEASSSSANLAMVSLEVVLRRMRMCYFGTSYFTHKSSEGMEA